ncbi:MAG: hypothetical protein QNM02_20485 [Acidimicrobiia bacterium]|nr:hypothetical protein [Acidimicrobiia bacterium]
MDENDERLVTRALELKSAGKSWRVIAGEIGVSEARLRTLRSDYETESEGALKPMDREGVTIFISHAHDDAALAQVLQDTLVDWGLNRDQVWRSSDPASGVVQGNEIPDDIKKFLFCCNLVLYVYTHSEKNWEWCSWEIGIAEEPSHLTRIVTFQILEDHAPKIRPASLRVGLTQESIERFVRNFFSEDDFFPGFEAFWPGREDRVLERRATELYDNLIEISSRYTAGEVPIWGTITLEVTGDELEAIEERVAGGADVAALDLELMGSLRLVAAEGWGVSHFGFSEAARAVQEEPTLLDIIDQWRNETGEGGDSPPRWAEELVGEIRRSRRNAQPKLSWRPSPSAFQGAAYFYPVVSRLFKTNDGGRRYRIQTFALDSAEHLSYGGAGPD